MKYFLVMAMLAVAACLFFPLAECSAVEGDRQAYEMELTLNEMEVVACPELIVQELRVMAPSHDVKNTAFRDRCRKRHADGSYGVSAHEDPEVNISVDLVSYHQFE